MTREKIKEQLEKLQNINFDDLGYDYEKFNKIRFEYDFLQLQITGLHMIESIGAQVEESNSKNESAETQVEENNPKSEN